MKIMTYKKELEFFRKILNNYRIHSCIIPAKDKSYRKADRGLRDFLGLEEEYDQLFCASHGSITDNMICKITDTGEIYESATPEPYTLMPLKTRAVSLYDSGITTSFLEMFGRSPRDTGYASERVSAPSASQRLHLLNSSHIRRKLEDSSFMRKIIDEKRNTKNFNNTYLHILSRYPTPDEIAKHKNVRFSDKYSHWHLRRDVAWALINSEEFLNRH
jgi:hypothetical protein